MAEGLDREGGPQAHRDGAVLQRRENLAVSLGRGDDRDVGVVLRRRPDHRGAADVDLLDQLVERDPGPLRRGRERIEVHDDELERRDRRAMSASR